MLTAVINAVRHSTFWLTLTNIVLGAAVVLCLVVIALEALCEAYSHHRRWRSYDVELNHDMQEMFATARPPLAAAHTKPPGAVCQLLEAVCRFWYRVTRRHN